MGWKALPSPRFTGPAWSKPWRSWGLTSVHLRLHHQVLKVEIMWCWMKRFVPAGRGRIVTAFLVNYFEKYVGYDFTADLEEQLDDVSGGQAD